MKKSLKIGLIVGGSLLVVGGAWAGLTKAGIIPNWLGIKISYNCIDCHGKFFYKGEDAQINGYSCCEGTYIRGIGFRDLNLERIRIQSN